MQKSVDVFLGYASEDRELSLEVMKRLKWLEREGLVKTWHEYNIGAGMEREREILRYLELAHIILLFVSADFIYSDFCYGVELKQAMERHERGESRVIPIVLRSVYWQETPLGKLQALPRENIPIKNWPDRDQALSSVEQDIRMVVKEQVAEEYIQEGRRLFNQGQYEKAFEACECALRWIPTSVVVHRLKGLVLSVLKRYDEALVAYEQVIRLSPDIASVHKERGDAFYHLKRYKDALVSYQHAISLKPDATEAYEEASKTLRELASENNRLAEEYEERARILLHSTGKDSKENFE